MKRFYKQLIDRFFPGKRNRARIRLESSDYSVIYAIGDVHGCSRELVAAEKKIAADSQAYEGRKLLVLVGDYVDRGPNSRAVLDFLCKPPRPEFERVALCGNHDDKFLRFLKNPKGNLDWLQHGGRETLRSYDIDADYILARRSGLQGLIRRVAETVPPQHIAFLETLPIILEMGGLVFVHAGIVPGLPIADQQDEDLMWMREPFLSEGPKLPITVIHGHTASEEPVFGRQRICIDTGSFATGRLAVLRIFGDNAAIMVIE
jgi:serine/threonine protein phosphatase 1